MVAPVEVCHAEGTDSQTSRPATTAVDILASDLLLLLVYKYSNTVAVSSAGDGTNSLAAAGVNGITAGQMNVVLWHKLNASAVSAGATMTVTLASAVSGWGWVLYRYPGSSTTVLDVSAVGTGAGSATPSSGSTGAAAGGVELAFAAGVFNDVGSAAWTVTTSGFSGLTLRSYGSRLGILPAYQELAAASGTYSVAFNDPNTVIASRAILALYKNFTTTYTASGSGGATVAGAATLAHQNVHPYAATGGATSGSTAAHARTRVRTASGGAAVAGSASTSFIPYVPTYAGSGGTVAAGSAVRVRVVVRIATGGVLTGGSAGTVSPGYRGSGGVALGGTGSATLERVPPPPPPASFYPVHLSRVIGGRARVLVAAMTYPCPEQLAHLFDLTTYDPNTSLYGWMDVGETKSAARIALELSLAQGTGEQTSTVYPLMTDWRGTASFELMELTQDVKARVLGAVTQPDPLAGQHRNNHNARTIVPFLRLALARMDPDGRLHATVIPRAQWDGSALERAFARGESESVRVNEAFYADENEIDAVTGECILCYDLESE